MAEVVAILPDIDISYKDILNEKDDLDLLKDILDIWRSSVETMKEERRRHVRDAISKVYGNKDLWQLILAFAATPHTCKVKAHMTCDYNILNNVTTAKIHIRMELPKELHSNLWHQKQLSQLRLGQYDFIIPEQQYRGLEFTGSRRCVKATRNGEPNDPDLTYEILVHFKNLKDRRGTGIYGQNILYNWLFWKEMSPKFSNLYGYIMPILMKRIFPICKGPQFYVTLNGENVKELALTSREIGTKFVDGYGRKNLYNHEDGENYTVDGVGKRRIYNWRNDYVFSKEPMEDFWRTQFDEGKVAKSFTLSAPRIVFPDRDFTILDNRVYPLAKRDEIVGILDFNVVPFSPEIEESIQKKIRTDDLIAEVRDNAYLFELIMSYIAISHPIYVSSETHLLPARNYDQTPLPFAVISKRIYIDFWGATTRNLPYRQYLLNLLKLTVDDIKIPIAKSIEVEVEVKVYGDVIFLNGRYYKDPSWAQPKFKVGDEVQPWLAFGDKASFKIIKMDWCYITRSWLYTLPSGHGQFLENDLPPQSTTNNNRRPQPDSYREFQYDVFPRNVQTASALGPRVSGRGRKLLKDMDDISADVLAEVMKKLFPPCEQKRNCFFTIHQSKPVLVEPFSIKNGVKQFDPKDYVDYVNNGYRYYPGYFYDCVLGNIPKHRQYENRYKAVDNNVHTPTFWQQQSWQQPSSTCFYIQNNMTLPLTCCGKDGRYMSPTQPYDDTRELQRQLKTLIDAGKISPYKDDVIRKHEFKIICTMDYVCSPQPIVNKRKDEEFTKALHDFEHAIDDVVEEDGAWDPPETCMGYVLKICNAKSKEEVVKEVNKFNTYIEGIGLSVDTISLFNTLKTLKLECLEMTQSWIEVNLHLSHPKYVFGEPDGVLPFGGDTGASKDGLSHEELHGSCGLLFKTIEPNRRSEQPKRTWIREKGQWKEDNPYFCYNTIASSDWPNTKKKIAKALSDICCCVLKTIPYKGELPNYDFWIKKLDKMNSNFLENVTDGYCDAHVGGFWKKKHLSGVKIGEMKAKVQLDVVHNPNRDYKDLRDASVKHILQPKRWRDLRDLSRGIKMKKKKRKKKMMKKVEKRQDLRRKLIYKILHTPPWDRYTVADANPKHVSHGRHGDAHDAIERTYDSASHQSQQMSLELIKQYEINIRSLEACVAKPSFYTVETLENRKQALERAKKILQNLRMHVSHGRGGNYHKHILRTYDSASHQSQQMHTPAKRQRTLQPGTIEALKEKPLRKIYIGSFVVPAGVESTCGIMTNMLQYLDIKSLCNVKRSSLIQQLSKEFGCDDLERVRDEALSLDYEGRRSINEMIFSHPARDLYYLIEKYKRAFPDGREVENIPTPIVCACEEGRMDDVELFMNLHPFHKYITNRDVNGYRDGMTLKDMVSQVGIDSDGYERTPLMKAAENEHFHVVQYLIEQGEADPNIANRYGSNALHYAVDNNNFVELIELLLAHMTIDSINKEDSWGETPLDDAYHRLQHSPSQACQEIIALLRLNGGIANKFDGNGLRIPPAYPGD